jgi:hypothetical protein
MSIFAEGFISPTSSLEDLSSDNNDQKTSNNSSSCRAKWKCPAVANSSSKMLEQLSIANNNEEGPKKMKACVKIWQTDGVSTRLFFAPNGSAMAASGAHNSVQVLVFLGKNICYIPYPLLLISMYLFGFFGLPQVMSSHVLLKLEKKDDFTRCDSLEKVFLFNVRHRIFENFFLFLTSYTKFPLKFNYM